MWASLLLRFRKPLVILLVIAGAAGYLSHVRYESGRADERAVWKPRFDAAERELKVANEKVRRQEEESTRVVAESQRRIDETQKHLAARLADADSRLRALSLRYTAAAARRCEVPATAGASPVPNEAAGVRERAERAGASFADIGGRAERDAARLAECVRIYTEQRAIMAN